MCDFAPIYHSQSSTQSPVDCQAPQRTRCPCRGVPRGRGVRRAAPAGHRDRNLPRPRCCRRQIAESNGWGDGCWAHWCISLVRVWVVLVGAYVFIHFTCRYFWKEMMASCQFSGLSKTHATFEFLVGMPEGNSDLSCVLTNVTSSKGPASWNTSDNLTSNGINLIRRAGDAPFLPCAMGSYARTTSMKPDSKWRDSSTNSSNNKNLHGIIYSKVSSQQKCIAPFHLDFWASCINMYKCHTPWTPRWNLKTSNVYRNLIKNK